MNLALAGMATAQTNLVLNGSFEDTINCDMPVIGIRKATHWYTANLASPDVWDADLDRGCGFALDPDGFPGLSYLAPFQGLRHAGEYFWFGQVDTGSTDTREYMMTLLSAPLVAGTNYEVSLHIALSPNMRYAVDHIGVWLGPDSLFESTPSWLSVTPQLRLRDPVNTYLTGNETWTLLKDTLIAQGGEQWMVIGNFDVADSVNGITAYPEALNAYAYYYIDSVSVRPVQRPSSVLEPSFSGGWSGSGLWVRWSGNTALDEVRVLDAQGRLVISERVDLYGGHGLLQSTSLKPGLYVVLASIGDRWFSTRFIKGVGGL
ncbi:MAG: T9SS type A sorting domain-containing protein [Flavobacteriales bacterium]